MAGHMTRLLVVMLVAMMFLSDVASATFRKPPFNGSIFGKRANTNDIEAAGQTLSSLCAVATEACSFWFPTDN